MRRLPTLRSKTLKLAKAVILLHQHDHNLVLTHENGAQRWNVTGPSGGLLTETDAQKILERPDVQPAGYALFDGCSQTFRLRRNWRAHFKYST